MRHAPHRRTFTADPPPLVLARSAPDTAVLVGGDGKLEALASHTALVAHRAGEFELADGVTRVADGEEEFGIGVPAVRVVAPRVIGRPEGETLGVQRHRFDATNVGGEAQGVCENFVVVIRRIFRGVLP